MNDGRLVILEVDMTSELYPDPEVVADCRRSKSKANIEFCNRVKANVYNGCTVILITSQLDHLDKRLRDSADTILKIGSSEERGLL